MRVGVVGAGIVGSCAAFELARSGAEVTLFERFEVDHDRGSSFGDSRIIRRFYDDPYYTRLMESAYPLWAALETASGSRLYERLGGLYFGPRGHPRLRSAEAGMKAAGAEPVQLDAHEMRERFPTFTFDDEETGLYDDRAGSLRASSCVKAAVGQARAAGTDVRTGVTVESVEPAPRGEIEIRTAAGDRHRFDRAMVCAGPWSTKLLARLALPVFVSRQQYVHLRPTRDAENFRSGAMPVWIDAASDWYGFPAHGDVEGVKIASHVFGQHVDPDDVDRGIDPADIARSRAYARKRLPALADGDVTYAKVCLYTVTPDEDFIVDEMPGVAGCFFMAGCSGHAFKFGTLLGAVGADLVRGISPRADISRFALARFERAT